MEEKKAVAAASSVVEYSPIAAALADLSKRFKGLVFDVATEDGLDQAKKARNEIRGYRTSLETKRTELKAPILERGRLLDSEAKRITAELEVLEKPIAAQIDAEDRRREEERQRKILAEQHRVAAIGKRIDAISNKVIAGVNMDTIELSATIDTLKATDLVEFAEFADKAKAAIEATVAKLGDMRDAKQRADEEAARVQAENDRLARERAEFERQQEQARQAAAAEQAARKIQEDADRAKREEEERKIARDRAELDRQRRELEEKQSAAAIADAEHAKSSISAPVEAKTQGGSEEAMDENAAAPVELVHSETVAARPLNPDTAWPFPSQRKREEAVALNVLLDSVAALRRIHEIAMDKENIDSWTAREEIAKIAAPFVEQPEQVAA